MRVQSPAEYSITKYLEQYNELKRTSEKIFREGIEARMQIAEFYKKLEELNAKNKKGVLTKDSVDIYV